MTPSASQSSNRAERSRVKRSTTKPCRYGKACTRPDCYFKHPAGHSVQSKPSGASQNASPKSVTLPKLHPWCFNREAGEWEVVSHGRCGVEDEATSSLTVISLNMWFDDHYREERTNAQLKAFRDLDASVICLQEEPTLAQIAEDKWVRDNFVLSDWEGTSFPKGHYGVVILVRKTIPRVRFRQLPLPGTMARSVVIAVLNTAKKVGDGHTVESADFGVMTTHLESMNSSPIRAKQLQCISNVAKQIHMPFLVCGDFNFCYKNHYRTENENMLQEMQSFEDLWPLLHDDDPGYTFDTVQNPMLKSLGRRRQKRRFDRMLLEVGPWKADSIDICGRQPFMNDSDGDPVNLSDHFGLVTRISK